MNHFVFLSTTSQPVSKERKPATLSPSRHTRTIYVKLLFLLSKTLKKKKKKTLLLLINMKATLLQTDKLKQDK